MGSPELRQLIAEGEAEESNATDAAMDDAFALAQEGNEFLRAAKAAKAGESFAGVPTSGRQRRIPSRT